MKDGSGYPFLRHEKKIAANSLTATDFNKMMDFNSPARPKYILPTNF